MIDREYVKLNSSIQTGSNSDHLEYDAEGNVKAVIELRLPENLFGSNVGPKKIENVAMQTSKFRLSMENTPIAQIPLDMELSKKHPSLIASTCQMDVYPFSFDDDFHVYPSPGENNAFPFYKQHQVTYTIRLTNGSGLSVMDEITCYTNAKGYGFPESSRWYPFLKEIGIFDKTNHLMNLCISSSHEPYNIQERNLYAKNLGTLVQMLQDGLENAITFACTSDHIYFIVDLVDTAIPDYMTSFIPTPKPEYTVYIEELDTTACLWQYQTDPTRNTSSCSLKFACKPSVKIGADSLTISYDSAAFDEIVPIIWNSAYVNTFGQPEQMSLDTFRKAIWTQPPPKRVYKYDVSSSSDGYSFSIPDFVNCLVMNIIANKAMKETFSFLPWMPIETKKYSEFDRGADRFNVTIQSSVTTSNTDALDKWYTNSLGSYPTYTAVRFTGASHSTYEIVPETGCYMYYEYLIEDGVEDVKANRINQVIDVGSVEGQETVYINKVHIGESEVVHDPTTDTEVVEQYTTSDASLSPGETVLNTSSGSRTLEPVVTYVSDASNNAHYDFLKSNKTSWEVADPPEGSFNDTGFTAGYTPARTPYTSSTSAVTIEGVTYNKVIKVWELYYNLDASSHMLRYSFRKPLSIYIQTTTTTTRETTETTTRIITENPEFTNDLSLTCQPNLDYDDVFYCLDGTTTEVSIGPQEVIQYDPKLEYLYQVDTTVSYEAQTMGTRIHSFGLEETEPGWTRYGNIVTTSTWADFTNCILVEYDHVRNPSSETCRITWLYTTLEENVNPSLYEIIDQVDSEWEPTYGPPSTSTREFSNDTSLTPGTTTTRGETVRTDTRISATRSLCYILGGKFLVVNPQTREPEWVDARVGVHAQAGRGVIDRNTGAVISGVFSPPDRAACYYDEYSQGDHYISRYVFSIAPASSDPNGNNRNVEIDYAYDWTSNYRLVDTTPTITVTVSEVPTTRTYSGNLRLNFTWPNLPMVVMSPIASIILTLDGVEITQEIQPYNIAQPAGSSLTATIPVVENFYSLAQTLRDLHDELVVVKEQFGETATYTLNSAAGRERVLRLTAKYLAKDGTVHQIYIPPKGVFSVQLTFGLSFFYSS